MSFRRWWNNSIFAMVAGCRFDLRPKVDRELVEHRGPEGWADRQHKWAHCSCCGAPNTGRYWLIREGYGFDTRTGLPNPDTKLYFVACSKNPHHDPLYLHQPWDCYGAGTVTDLRYESARYGRVEGATP